MPVQLPPMPRRIGWLPRDARGYPVPWFIQWMCDGKKARAGALGAKPDFRVADSAKVARIRRGEPSCWICGDRLGVYRVFAIGPMCAVNRVTLEPPSHRECAEFAVVACPFLARPRMRRIDSDDLDKLATPGIMIERNPGAVCLWETQAYRWFDAGNGQLISLGQPTRVDWWREGRKATRDEIIDSIDSGLPLLRRQCLNPDDHKALDAQLAATFRLLPVGVEELRVLQ